MSEDELLPLHDQPEASGFDVVLRGYDRRQVEDYIERVEVALAEADHRHAEDGERLAALEHEVAAVHVRLEDAEQRAAGLPDPARHHAPTGRGGGRADRLAGPGAGGGEQR
jgi:hypothetical protein